MDKNLTCIICPKGCSIRVTLEEGRVEAISGHTCPRGEEYARAECISPMRTVTSTVRCANGELVPVKTDRPIPKDKIFECMTLINHARPVLPIRIGDVIIEDAFGSKIIATANKA